ncbi:MAG: D-alanine--D-alanine ligase family protein [Desulfovibrio sp.]|uniref:D-alanine--D-alanine ligase family protein n=1 Tax=Desulfovibrio sp. 7SRBS1 TaxID=3378064 RepID=UPI003B40BDE8
MHILLIAGGWSDEREVSLSGGKQIEESLKRLGHTVTRLDPQENLSDFMDLATAHDFAFINLHGSPGEDGLFQAMLEEADCPYQGANPKASFLSLNKATTKLVYQQNGLPTPDWDFLPVPPSKDWKPDLEFPFVVKPNNGGSSIGMSLVRTPEEMPKAFRQVFESCKEVLVEELVEGIEITCAVLGDEALPPILIKPNLCNEFFDYASKYEAGGADEICPAPVDEELSRKVMDMALTAHRALGITGYSRTDFMVRGGTEPMCIETNTLPGMTPTSLVPKAAAARGMSFDALIARLIELGLETHGHPQGKSQGKS